MDGLILAVGVRQSRHILDEQIDCVAFRHRKHFVRKDSRGDCHQKADGVRLGLIRGAQIQDRPVFQAKNPARVTARNNKKLGPLRIRIDQIRFSRSG